jgi:hypothetical protein
MYQHIYPEDISKANKLTEDGRPASNPKHTSSIELFNLKLGHAGCLFSVSVFHGAHKAFIKVFGGHVPASAMLNHLPDRRTSDVGSLSISAAFASRVINAAVVGSW